MHYIRFTSGMQECKYASMQVYSEKEIIISKNWHKGQLLLPFLHMPCPASYNLLIFKETYEGDSVIDISPSLLHLVKK